MSAEPIAIRHATGQGWAERNAALVRAFALAQGVEAITSDAARLAAIDGQLVRAGVLRALVEAKCRGTHTRAVLTARYGDTFLISLSKLTPLATCARYQRVPGYVIAELACGERWSWRVYGDRGQPLFPWAVRYTETRATSLGPETTWRDNAYLPFCYGKRWG